MTDIKQQIKIDAKAYKFQINEHSDYKNGFFHFDGDDLTVKISFTSDEYGNIDSLGVTNAEDSQGEPSYFSISNEAEYKAIVDQIEPHLWGESTAVETEHGMTNSDFMSDYA